MDSLAVLNKFDFYICESCGFGKIEKDFVGKKIKYKHLSPSGYSCDGELNRYTLGHEFLTDVVFIKFRDVENMRKPEVAWTILYSLVEGLSRTLDIDRKELSGCIQWYRDNSSPFGNYGCILFDNTPGGAGYVKKLENKDLFMKMLKLGRNVVNLCNCGGKQADTVCYGCLCNYYNQRQHEIMKRIYALDFYNLFFDEDKTIPKIEEIKLNNEKYDGSVEIEKIDLKFTNQGIYQESSSLNDIWQYIIEDCDSLEKVIISKLARKTQGKNIEHPIYNEIIINPKNGDEIFVNEIWKDKKVMLFLTENYDDYLKALKTGWKCFCTKEKFDVEELIKLVEV